MKQKGKPSSDDAKIPEKEALLMKESEESKDEVKKKLEQLKTKLDAFQNKVLDKFKEYILGIALLPPENKQPPMPGMPMPPVQEKKESFIDILVVIDDSDVKKMTKWELKDRLTAVMDKIAAEIDKEFKPQPMLMSELREICFDAKYDILQLIAYSAPVYDPRDVLKAIKIAEVHKTMVLKKFEKYIVSYVAVGSLFRGDSRSNDIDVAVVVDDTDVKKMARIELRDKLGAIVRSLGYEAAARTGVEKVFHIQVYILTDFWEAIKEASPVIFTFLRDGIPLYDRGIFMPWRLLLEMGRIRPSPESIDMHMSTGSRFLERAKGKLLSVVAEDLYYACLNPSQAALMIYGVPPTTPKETIKMMDEIFVKKEKMLEPKYVAILQNVVQTFKDIEHGKITEISGTKVDELTKEINMYLERINKLFSQIEKSTEKQRALAFYHECTRVLEDVLAAENIKSKEVLQGFKKLCDAGKFPKQYLQNVKEMLRLKDHQKLSKQEIEKIMRENAFLLRILVDYIQRKKGLEYEKAKYRIKYGDKIAEVYIIDEHVFLVEDAETDQKSIKQGKITAEGHMIDMKKSGFAELEKAMKERKSIASITFKEQTFQDLRNLLGKDVEVLLN